MATTKTFTENSGSGTKSAWTLLFQEKDVTAQSPSIPYAPKLSAKYVGSNKGYTAVNVDVSIIANGVEVEGKWKNYLVGLSEATSGVTYVYNEDSIYPPTFYTSNLFNSSNPTTKKIAVTITKKADDTLTLASDNKSISGSNYGKYDAGASVVNFGTVGYITLDAPPTFETTQVSTDTPYIYAGFTTASVTVSSLSAKYGGNISSVAFTIGNQTTTEMVNGVLSISLNAGGTFTPTVTVTDSRGQVTTKSLNAITVNTYVAPSVSFSVERTDSSGVLDDEGTSAVVTAQFNWTDDVVTLSEPTLVVKDPDNITVSVTKTWYSARESDMTFDPQNEISDWSTVNESEIIYCLVSGNSPFDTQYSYQILLTPNDSEGSGTTITQTLGSAFYTVDFLAGGHGIAFGQPSSDTGFYCNMDAYFKDKANRMRALFDFFYPVGSYYETSDTSFDPNVSWGGTWSLETAGQVHISAGTGYAVAGALTDTSDGGSADAVIVSHGHTASGGAVGNNPSAFNTNTDGYIANGVPSNGDHHHTIAYDTVQRTSGTANTRYPKTGTNINTSTDGAHTHNLPNHKHTIPANSHTHNFTQPTISTEGVSGVGKNMQPYIIVNRWHRTA